MIRAWLSLLLLLACLPACASDFWLRGPGNCLDSNGSPINGDGTKYACAASAGAAGAWVVDRSTNVNTGKWGNTASTVGAGDRLFICDTFDLPLTGADARDFLKVSGVTFDAANPMVINLGCPAGVTNGPAVADPVQADLKEDYRLRTWTDQGNNTWSTPNDGASIYTTYVACNDPDALGTETDSGNRIGNGTFPPDAFCEFDSRGNSSTTLLVYSVGHPSTYYTKLWASARNFIQVSNPIGVQILGDTTVSNYEVTWGSALLQHMNLGVYLGTFSSATTYTINILVQGIACKNMGACIQHDGQSLSTYYPRAMVWEKNACLNMARPCLWLSGKVGAGTEVRYNYAKNVDQSYSAGAIYIAANLDRATHPQEPIYVHHNFVDGVGFGKVWPSDGHGIYIEEGMKGVSAYANWVQNLTATNQVGFISNSAYSGNSHSASVCINCYTLAKQSDSASNGNASTLFQNLTGVEITGTALTISGQASDAPTFRNIHVSASAANSNGFLITQNATSITPTFQGINAYGFRANDYYNGSTSAPLSGETKNAPGLVGRSPYAEIWDLRTGRGSALRRAGVEGTQLFGDVRGCPFTSPSDIGAFSACSGDPANARAALASPRTRAAARSVAPAARSARW